MRNSRRQIFLIIAVVQFVSMLLASGISSIMSASQVGIEISEGFTQQRLTALDLAKRTQLSAEEIMAALSLSTYPMHIVDWEGTKLTQEQERLLRQGGSVDTKQHGYGGCYFLLRDELVMIEAKPYNAMVISSAMRGFFSNLMLTAIVVLMFFFGSKQMVQSWVDLTAATREIAAGNFQVRMPEKPRKKWIRSTKEEIELAKNFNRMAKELQSIEYLRRDFTSNVSHEIKTPIASISGYAQLLEGEEVSEEERREYAGAIKTESKKLAKLSDNLLKLTRLESQQIRPPATRFLLDEQLRRAVSALYPEMEQKKIEITSELPETWIVADEELLEQVWQNLLDNAVKFTPENGQIHVSIAPSVKGWAVRVEDNGIGMEPAALERMYEKFYQSDASRHEGGNGLGLSLVKRIVDICGGSIAAKSEPGKGTAITVFLPKS